jgi:hypothetical protein
MALVVASEPALACRIPAQLELKYVKYADLVVAGRIANYKIVLDQEARRERRKMLARSPNMSPELRKALEGQTNFLSDYARFDVIVDRVLFGIAPKAISVTWDNSTFSEPTAIAPGRYLVALRNPSATELPNGEPGTLTVLQAPCAPAFIFGSDSAQATALRKVLGAGSN